MSSLPIGYTTAGPEASQLASEGSPRDARKLEIDLLNSGSLAGLHYEFVVHGGNISDALELIIQQSHVDAVVMGTHGRGGLGKLVLGSVAEQVFRRVDCPVLTVRPGTHEDSLANKNGGGRTFLLATDFGPGASRCLPYAVVFAHHFGAGLIVLHVLPEAPVPESFHWSMTGDLLQMRRRAQRNSETQFRELILPSVPPEMKVEFLVRFGTASEQILEACRAFKTDLLILGLHRTDSVETASHWPWTTAYELVSSASCPVLAIKNAQNKLRRSVEVMDDTATSVLPSRVSATC